LSERKKPLAEYGIAVKVELLKRSKTQNWLIEEVKKILPNKYLDTSNLNRIMTGELNSPEIVAAINEVLGFENCGEEGHT
jgi:hypothetical protein